MSGATAGLLVAVFAACVVEAVEAVTIVLAVGVTRGWRPALAGVAAGLAVLALLIAGLGPALTTVPLGTLRLVVGGLLLVFGLQWLRKAILRASGRKALHDEDAIFAAERQRASDQAAAGGRLDPYGVAVAFKGVLLEGLEVAFIVLTFGSNQGKVGLAALAAGAAVLLVLGIAIAVRAPLSRVPENMLKFGVAVLLSSFGMFWGAEGAGVAWPGGDAALAALIPLMLLCSLALIASTRRVPNLGSEAS